MVQASTLTNLFFLAGINASSCLPAPSDCTAYIYALAASPYEATLSDSVTISHSAYVGCSALSVLTFPDYDASSVLGYQATIQELPSVQGIVLRETEDGLYQTQELPLTSIIGDQQTPDFLDYTVTFYGGFSSSFTFSDSLDDFIAIQK